MTNNDVTLIDLTYLLIAIEAKMLKNTCQANMFERSVSQVFMDIDNGNIGSPEKASLPMERDRTKSNCLTVW